MTKNLSMRLKNTLAPIISESPAIRLLLDNLNKPSAVDDLIVLCAKRSKALAIRVLIILITEGRISEKPILLLCEMVQEHSHLLMSPSIYNDFIIAVRKIRYACDGLSQFCIETLINALEMLFAKGFHGLHRHIARLYEVSYKSLSDEDDSRYIRKKLSCVYAVNPYNSVAALALLHEVHDHCRMAHLKYAYGAIDYYYAVFYLLSDGPSNNLFSSFLIDSVDRDFHLAKVMNESGVRSYADFRCETAKPFAIADGDWAYADDDSEDEPDELRGTLRRGEDDDDVI